MTMYLTKQGAAELVAELRRTVPNKNQLSVKEVEVAMKKLEQACEFMACDANARQSLWVAKIHHTLGHWLKAIVARAPINDPNSELLYLVCNALQNLIQLQTGDCRAGIGDQALGALAALTLSQGDHDAECVEGALKLFASLFSGVTAGADSQKHLKKKFFGLQPDGSVKADDETAIPCLQMLRDPALLLCEARTFQSQVALCDVLVRAPRPPPSWPRASFPHAHSNLHPRAP